MKNIYKKPTGSIILNDKTIIPLREQNEDVSSHHSWSTQCSKLQLAQQSVENK